MTGIILLRGGGDLASGVALRLLRAGFKVVVTELAQPLAVRRSVSFATAVFSGKIQIEEILAQRVDSARMALALISQAILPVLVDPQLTCRDELDPLVMIDGRMTKQAPETGMGIATLVIGLGPGFTVGENCHAVVETQRGPYLGRVYWQGSAEPDSGLPDVVGTHAADRVLRAPVDGVLANLAAIGDMLELGDAVTEVAGMVVRAPFKGLLRGLLPPGLFVRQDMKIGDLDPRADLGLINLVSDKALAVGGGALEAVLTRPDIRQRLWNG